MCSVSQGPLIEDTSKLMNTTLQISCASVQAFLVAVAAERDFSKWKLRLDISLLAVAYTVCDEDDLPARTTTEPSFATPIIIYPKCMLF